MGSIVPVENVQATAAAIEQQLQRPGSGEKVLTKIREYTLEEMARRHIEILSEK